MAILLYTRQALHPLIRTYSLVMRRPLVFVSLSLTIAIGVLWGNDLFRYFTATEGPSTAHIAKRGMAFWLRSPAYGCTAPLPDDVAECITDNTELRFTQDGWMSHQLMIVTPNRRDGSFFAQTANKFSNHPINAVAPDKARVNKALSPAYDVCSLLKMDEYVIDYECRNPRSRSREVRYLKYVQRTGTLTVIDNDKPVLRIRLDQSGRLLERSLISHELSDGDVPVMSIVTRAFSYPDAQRIVRQETTHFRVDKPFLSRQWQGISDWYNDAERWPTLTPTPPTIFLIGQYNTRDNPLEITNKQDGKVLTIKYEYHE